MAPVWTVAARRTRAAGSATARVGRERSPLLAALSAFAFTLMMFNVPVVGGTTAHPVGAVLLAITLGPWEAILGMTVALAVQALLFADGGLLAFPANCMVMGVVGPVVGWQVYRTLAGRSALDSRRRAFAAGAAAYVGVNASALTASILLGIQPLLFHDALGRPLYFPLGLGATLPGVLLPHLIVVGGIEAAVTTTGFTYLVRACPELLNHAGTASALDTGARDGAGPARLRWKRAWIALAILAMVSPLGLLAPGSAWGEWDSDYLRQAVGYVPGGFSHLADRWRPPLADYSWHGNGLPGGFTGAAAGYILSAAIGIALITAAFLLRGVRRLPSGEEFAKRTVADIAGAAREMAAQERWSRPERGFLQRTNPAVKWLGALALLVVVSSVRSPALIAGALLAAVAVGAASGIPVRILAARALRFGAPALVLIGAAAMLPTAGGPYVALTLSARMAASLSVVVLLALTTPWQGLLAGLRRLGVPATFLETLDDAYRHLYRLPITAAEMFQARLARTVGIARTSDSRRFVGFSIGALLGKTHAMAEASQQAMSARGGLVAADGRPAIVDRQAPDRDAPLFRLSDVTYRYPNGTLALDSASVRIAPGASVALLGANGSGKSTLLRLLNGLIVAESGSVAAFGDAVTADTLADPAFARALRRRVGLVFQDADAMLFSATVRAELAFGPALLGLSATAVDERINELASYCRIVHLLDRAPYQLSGGEKRRVCLAAALSTDPEVLLLDEPTTGLDPRSRDWLMSMLDSLTVGGHLSLIVATHDLAFASAVCTRGVILCEGHHVLGDGSLQDLLADRSLLLQANLISGQ
jgi:cobalt/nickel transport system permease protein